MDVEVLLREAIAPDYVLIRHLADGGMGSVYVAREPALKRLVAVKVLSPQLAHDETARKRFEREAQSAAAISHPNNLLTGLDPHELRTEAIMGFELGTGKHFPAEVDAESETVITDCLKADPERRPVHRSCPISKLIDAGGKV